jgi:hypothetical protein
MAVFLSSLSAPLRLCAFAYVPFPENLPIARYLVT